MWNRGELRSFLAAASEHRYAAFYATAAFTGARRGELLHLRWTDLDLDVRTMQIRGSARVIDGQWVDGPTKGGDHRSISLDAGTVALLRDLREEQQVKRETAADSWEGWDQCVFITGLKEGFRVLGESGAACAVAVSHCRHLPPGPSARGHVVKDYSSVR